MKSISPYPAISNSPTLASTNSKPTTGGAVSRSRLVSDHLQATMFRLSSRRVVELETQVKDLQDELQVKGAASEDVSERRVCCWASRMLPATSVDVAACFFFSQPPRSLTTDPDSIIVPISPRQGTSSGQPLKCGIVPVKHCPSTLLRGHCAFMLVPINDLSFHTASTSTDAADRGRLVVAHDVHVLTALIILHVHLPEPCEYSSFHYLSFFFTTCLIDVCRLLYLHGAARTSSVTSPDQSTAVLAFMFALT